MGYMTENVNPADVSTTFATLAQTIKSRRDADPEKSYTSKLLNQSEEKLLKKIGEEAIETILAVNSSKEHLRYEIADLFYHVMVLMEKHDLTLEDIAGELSARMK